MILNPLKWHIKYTSEFSNIQMHKHCYEYKVFSVMSLPDVAKNLQFIIQLELAICRKSVGKDGQHSQTKRTTHLVTIIRC